jgi:CRP/FNR family cyclic AMP-dependent transcriptional regulator
MLAAAKLASHSSEQPPLFANFPPALAQSLQNATLTNSYPAGAILFAEGEPPRGIFIVRRGRVKLSVCARDGRTLILRLAGPGEAMGVASTIAGRDYEVTAETQEFSEISFLRRSDLLQHMRTHGELALWVTQQISHDYNSTCREIRNLMLSGSASEKLARLLIGWIDPHAPCPCKMKLGLTHEEMAQMIGTSRETVTRLMAGFKRQRLIEQVGATVVIPDRTALESLISQ